MHSREVIPSEASQAFPGALGKQGGHLISSNEPGVVAGGCIDESEWDLLGFLVVVSAALPYCSTG